MRMWITCKDLVSTNMGTSYINDQRKKPGTKFGFRSYKITWISVREILQYPNPIIVDNKLITPQNLHEPLSKLVSKSEILLNIANYNKCRNKN